MWWLTLRAILQLLVHTRRPPSGAEKRVGQQVRRREPKVPTSEEARGMPYDIARSEVELRVRRSAFYRVRRSVRRSVVGRVETFDFGPM